MTQLRTRIPDADLLGNMGFWLEVDRDDLELARSRQSSLCSGKAAAVCGRTNSCRDCLPSGLSAHVRVEGFELPATVGLDLKVILTDADAGEEGARQGEQTDLPRLIPLESGALHTAGVLDGRYRVNVQGHSSRWESSAEHIGRRIQIDTDDWPAEIEIRGNTVELPPVRLRMAADIVNLSPADGTAVNLSDLDLRWEPVPNADQYGVQFGSIVNTPHVTVSLFVFARNSRPQLTVNDLSELERRQLRENLPVGRTALWKVVAWDAAGRQIGVMLNENRFLVAGALP